MNEKILEGLFSIALGLFLCIFYKSFGKKTLDERVKLNNSILNTNFKVTKKDISINQYVSIIVGTVFILLGLNMLIKAIN